MQLIQIQSDKKSTTSVLIIYTGGTLGMVYDKNGQLIPFDFEQILRKVPELKQLDCELSIYSFEKLIDSSNVAPEDWINIAGIIEKYYNDFDGFVLLHGTDTMAYTASALSFLLEGLNKPVICTGAQLPIGAIRNDARRNLVTSIQVAATPPEHDAHIREVCIYFNDVLLRGNRSKKTESILFDAFHSENYPPLAKVGVNIEYNFGAFLPKNSQYHLKTHTRLSADVGILKLFPGISETFVHSVLQVNELKGIVLETYGSGNAPTLSWFTQALGNAIEKGLVIFNVSQCLGGKVVQGRYETSRHLLDLGVISGDDITTEAAVTKMMFLFGLDLPLAKVREILPVAIRGEMSKGSA